MTIQPQQIVINSDLIRMLGKKLYSLPHPVILVRELFQNAIDACSNSSKAKIEFTFDSNAHTIICKDTGIGMSEHILLDVFLSIGSSYKLGGSIGGFGIAKVAIFACVKWSVQTTCGYIDETLQFNPNFRTKVGTIVTCQLDDNDMYYHSYEAQKFICSSNWNSKQIKVFFNDKPIKPLKSIYEYATDSYTVSMSKGIENLRKTNVFRIHGLTQFCGNRYDNTDDINMVVDVECSYKPTDDKYPFNMSRESLESSIRHDINARIESILTDKYSNANKIADGNTKYTDKVIRGIALHYYKPIGELNSLRNRRIAQLFFEICNIVPHDRLSGMPGLTNNPECIACISDKTQCYINPDNIKFESIEGLILVLWHIACHEIAHQTEDYHNEGFTSQEGFLSRESSEMIAKNMQKWAKKYRVLLNSKDSEE